MSQESHSLSEPNPMAEGGPRRSLEPYLQSDLVDGTALVSWQEGPKTGEVYNSVRLDDCDFSCTPTIEKIEEQILEYFREHQAEGIEPGTFMSDESKRVELAIGGAISTLYLAYYGTIANGGIELAQMFDLNGEGQRYNTFANNIITDGRRAYLSKFGLQHGIKGLDISYGASYAGVNEVAKLCFAGDGDLEEYSGMALTHSTVSDITPAIIQMEAVTCDNVRQEAGLTKMSGEIKGGRAHGAEYVFFWPNETVTRTSPFVRAFDPSAGLELPAVWGIKDISPLEDAGIQINDGNWCGEKMIAGEVPLEFFTNLWVPPIGVARHAELLAAHGFGHIQVSPFPPLRR